MATNATDTVNLVMETAAVEESQRSSLATVAGFIPSVLLKVVGFATISIPVFFYRVLTWSFTLHLNFSSLLIIMAFVVTAAYLVVRYRFLTKYSRLTPVEPPKVASSFDLHPDSGEDSSYSKPGFKNYPDEFLSAFLSSIKIFGYLEQPVFHELARHLQTKKLLAGDTLFRSPDQERSFYIVVDGHVQMFVKPDNMDDDEDEDYGFDDAPWEDPNAEDQQDRDKFRNYTLINEVGAGGTLSSLFTILSIFRESFIKTEEKQKLRQKVMQSHLAASNKPIPPLADPYTGTGQPAAVDMSREASTEECRHVFPNLESTLNSETSSVSASDVYRHRLSSAGSASGASRRTSRFGTSPVTGQDDPLASVGRTENLPELLHVDKDDYFVDRNRLGQASDSVRFPQRPHLIRQPSQRSYRSMHPNIIARATVDTTLAVIPEEAFVKLTMKFPKAAAHIVQVIVTRFQRVTLMTSHRYLGLSKELLRLERLINESASLRDLPPDFLTPGCLERLRNKFVTDDETKRDSEDTSAVPIELSRSESTGIIKAIGIIDHPGTSSYRASPGVTAQSPLSDTSSMLNSSPQSRIQRHNKTPENRNEYSIEDDEYLRSSVVRHMADILGISMESPSSQAPSSPYAMSPRQSRRMSPEESAKARYPHYPMDLFTHAGTVDSSVSPTLAPSTDLLFDDVDVQSTTSSVLSGSEAAGIDRQRSDSLTADDIQILYFPKDAVLVHEGEHNSGIFFVIDGLLNISMTAAEGERVLSDRERPRNSMQDGQVDDYITSSKLRSKSSFAKRSEKHHSKHPSHFTLSPSSSISSVHSENTGGGGAQSRSAVTPFTPTMTDKHNQTVASEAPAGRRRVEDQETIHQQKIDKPSYTVKSGGLVGYLDALTGYPSFVEISAKTDTYVGYLSKKTLDRISDRYPAVMLKLAKQLVGFLSPLILHIDLSLEWMQVNAGQIISREGEPSDSIYMVLHGRLRTIKEKSEGDIDILGEFGHGDSVGELEVLTGTPTPSTLHAIRDSELARMPKTLFNALALRHPEITLQISRMVAYRSLQLMMNKNAQGEIQGPRVFSLASSTGPSEIANISSAIANKGHSYPELYGRNNVNLKTIGILPVNSSVPLTEFAESLKTALLHSVGASCVLLNSTTVTTVMGKHAFSRMGKLKMASWLAEQEEKVRIVLYLADSGVTSQWTRTCIRQADCILLVGLGDGDPSVGEYERFLINMKTTARKELVLLHRERSCGLGTTQNWLKNRLWIQAHHHIYMPMKQHATLSTERIRPPWLAQQGRKMTAGSINMLNNVKDQLEKYYSAVPTFGRLLVVRKKGDSQLRGVNTASRNDFARLARRLCGKSVALVLGGGGARGISHIGVIQAMEEAGIPIDIIGGTSIGSFVGALYAKNMDLVATIARSKLFAGRVSSIWRQLMDLTYPVTAWFTGHEFNRGIWKCLGDSLIEDFWLPYFAVTTNITFSRMEVHTTGYAWRYVRASMSLSGYMPPICENGNMLVDGGYMDNLPVSVAKNMGADIIIAVDVASDDDTSPVYYGDSISGWWALLHSFNPFRTYNIPSIADIQSRLAYVSSVAKLEEAKMTNGTLYLKLPVQQWGTLEFNKFNDIMKLGYDVGREVVGRWRKGGYVSGRLMELEGDGKLRGKEVKGKRGRRNSI
ncbi:uncharacterized protein BYT42DRAFT_585297 [Radiomyces spectabilis]|uniref:uncharacterized protein n=1 Tax=Radiomyces spectabilis TaxID=64574 RepID=UPI0022212352|nr:uncharacterized protein BYT42DRAFT_585297 [Radiomyces spectabilis]KAI8368105.1 hypothetical protein BYT42DRAFT_585297 [Radiomyces spectabilis]